MSVTEIRPAAKIPLDFIIFDTVKGIYINMQSISMDTLQKMAQPKNCVKPTTNRSAHAHISVRFSLFSLYWRNEILSLLQKKDPHISFIWYWVLREKHFATANAAWLFHFFQTLMWKHTIIIEWLIKEIPSSLENSVSFWQQYQLFRPVPNGM